MPSIEHGALVHLFRGDPELALHVLRRALAVPVPRGATAAVVEAALDQLATTELRADLVVRVARRGRAVLALIVEVQLGVDRDKRYSWPAYAALLRSRERCPVVVLVITPSRRVARWAARPVALGPGNQRFRVLVVGPRRIPRIRDEATAARHPALGWLSARAHADRPGGAAIAFAALQGLRALDPENIAVYSRLLLDSLEASTRHAVEALMMEPFRVNPEDLPPWPPRLQRMFDRAEEIGARRAEAAAAEAIARAEASAARAREAAREAADRARKAARKAHREAARRAAEAARGPGPRREALYLVLQARKLRIGPAQRARIDACADPEVLDRWIARAATAQMTRELFV
jgi:hypothetical protein